MPRLIYSNSEVVDKLVQSGVADYLEFRSVRTGVMWTGSAFEVVPCNKAEIFQAANITMLEKRLLMRFIENCQKMLELDGLDDHKDFTSFMEEMKLTRRLQEILLYGVLIHQGGSLSVGTAVTRLRQYSESLGKYKDNKALLYPMYGSSDISQAYCRLAAVYQAIYCLSVDFTAAPAIDPVEHQFVVHTSLGDIRAKQVVCGAAYADQSFDSSVECVSQAQFLHGCIISPVELFAVEDGDPVLLSVPPGCFNNANPIYILQLSSSTNTVAADHFLYHVSFQIMPSDDPVLIYEQLSAALPLTQVFRSSYIQHSNSRSSSLGVLHLLDAQGDFEFKANFEIAQMTFSSLESSCEFLPKRKVEDAEDETDKILEEFV
jgi:RAB protein geranylgeranyltransferase component A